MDKMKISALLLAIFLLMSVTSMSGCNGNEEEESSIPEASGGVNGDVNISDVSATNDEDEEERQKRLFEQASEILSENTEYSDRFIKFKDLVQNGDCTILFTKDEYSNNGLYTYKYVNNGNNWYYYICVVDVDNDNKKSEYAYSEKDGKAYSYNYDDKIVKDLGEIESSSKSREAILPIFGGIKIKEQTEDNFMGNKYSCDVYSYTTPEYNDDFQNLHEKDAGTVKVFYDSNDNVKGIVVTMSDGLNGYSIQIDGFENKADMSVFDVKNYKFS